MFEWFMSLFRDKTEDQELVRQIRYHLDTMVLLTKRADKRGIKVWVKTPVSARYHRADWLEFDEATRTIREEF